MNEQLTVVGEGVPATHAPALVQVLTVVVLVCVPVSGQTPAPATHEPVIVELLHTVPDGLKVHACEVVVGVPVTQVPVALQVRGVVTNGWVPLVEHPEPDWLQVPGAELVPQSKPGARFVPLVHVGTPGVRHAMTPKVQGFEFPVHELPSPGHEAEHAPPAVHAPPGQV